MESVLLGRQPEECHPLQANVNQNVPTSWDMGNENALRYAQRVKSTFGKHSEVYNQFLEITQDFRKDRFDTSIIIKRVTHLFQGRAKLTDGFNIFLPPRYTMPAEISTAQPFLSSTAAEEIRI